MDASRGPQLPSYAEVVVVGAGVLGSATAFHLSVLGRNVLHLERGALASETSSQGAGFLCSVRPKASSTQIVRYSTDFYVRFTQETGFDIDLHLTGGVRVALGKDWLEMLRAESETARLLGGTSDLLSPAELRDRLPGFELGAALGGTFTPLEGYMTATREAAIGLARGAVRRGSILRTYEHVESVAPVAGGSYDVVSASGTVRAETVVLAANAFLWPMLRRLDIPFGAYPVHHQCAVYDTPAVVDPDLPTVRIGERDLYIRREVGGLMVGGVGAQPSSPSTGAADAAFELGAVQPDRPELEAMRARATAFVPALAGAPVIREQRGLAIVAPDLEPMPGEIAPRLFVATADLRGIQSGPGLGLMLAQLIATGQSEWDSRPYRPDRFGDLARDPEAVRTAATDGIRPGLYAAG